MPVAERDPWRLQYFEGLSCPDGVLVPTDDIDCWELFPQFRWIYEKLNIARSQNLPCGTAADMPESFPVFAKPNINLRGMGLGSHAIHSRQEFRHNMPAGHMWMPLLTGEHVSTDCAVLDGRPVWMRHAHGEAWRDGMFKHWVIECGKRPELTHTLSAWVQRHMAGYTGMMNVETIGGTMIEAHLRFADQWCDLYGKAWLQSLVSIYAEHRWTFDGPCRPGYSVPLFASHGIVPPHPPKEVQATIRAMPGISSLQITYHAAKADAEHPMPPGGFRLAVINCFDLEAGLRARRVLAKSFPGCELLIPDD